MAVDNSKKRLFDIHIPAKDITWIDLSLVTIMKQLYDFEFIQRALLSDGINIKVAKWGNYGLFCVLTFNTVDDKNEAWKGREEGLAFWFDHVELLLNNKGIPAAFLSISLIGVPLHCWHETFFEALGNRWGSFVSIDTNTKSMVDFSVARMTIHAESPHDIPCSLNIRSLGRNYIIKSLSPPSGKEVLLVKEAFLSRANPFRVGTDLVDNHSTINSPPFSMVSALHRVEDVFKEPTGGVIDELPDGRPGGFGLDNSPKQTFDPTSSNSVDGLGNVIIANSSEAFVGQHISPSFEFVPDNFEGLENSFTGKDTSRDCVSIHGIPHAILVNSTPCSLNNTLLNPSHKRAVRRSVREALESPSSCNGCSPPLAPCFDSSIIKEATAV
ncbi:hypothetical protein V6N13_061354 [Hibiscus sabdariffa]